MQALVVSAFGSADVLEWCDVDEPVPATGEVVVAVDAVAVDWADIIKRRGTYPGGPQPPFVTGHNMVGRVVAHGDGVTRPALGSRVFGAVPTVGVAAERVAVPAQLLHPAPEAMPDVQVAGLAGSYFTAQLAVSTYGRLVPGEAVLVQAAAGAFGSASVDLARHHGAGLVLGTAGSDEKVAVLEEAGVDVAINYTTQDFVEEVATATGGSGVDLVVESVGGEVLGRSFDCVRPGGRMVSVGASAGRSSERFRLHTLFQTGVSVAGFSVGHLLANRPELVEEAADVVLQAAASGRLSPLVGHVLERDDAASAHRLIEARGSVGRVVIAMSRATTAAVGPATGATA